MVWLVEVGGHWFVQLPCCYVGSVAIHPNVKSVSCFSHIILHVAPAAANHVYVLCLACELMSNLVFTSCGVAREGVGGVH